jgi:serine/threonine protein kinase
LLSSYNDTEFQEYVLREVEVLKKLDHPNIVKFFVSFEEDDSYFIVFEYVDGGDLKNFLKSNPHPHQ